MSASAEEPFDLRFVATDGDGVQHLADHRRAWPLPGPGGEPGAPARVHGDEHPLQLQGIDGLLETLGDRIFLAEAVHDGARLVRELTWDLARTASFALDCAEHALVVLSVPGGPELLLPDGAPVASLLEEARRYLDSAGATEDRRISALSRLSLARRVGKEQRQVAALALATAGGDVAGDVDVLDDPRWANLAALSSALLACVEVLRHLALPRYVAARERTFEDEAGGEPLDPGEPWMTPWGPVSLTSAHVPTYVPAYVSAREAAERARQAVADQAGAEAGSAERAYQRGRLLELLGLRSAH